MRNGGMEEIVGVGGSDGKNIRGGVTSGVKY